MRKKKHILITAVLIAVMAFGISAAAVYAQATNEYYYCIGSDDSDNPYSRCDPDAEGHGEGWSYDPKTKTLELNGFGENIDSPYGEVIYFAGFDLTISLKGDNRSFYIGKDYEDEGSRTLTVQGSGSLNVHGYGMFSDTVKVKGGKIDITSYDAGIAAENFEMTGSPKLTIAADWTGISAKNATIKEGTLTLKGGSDGVGDSGICQFREETNDVNISGGNITINNVWNGIYVGGNINITGGNVYVNANEHGIAAWDSVLISGKNTRVETFGAQEYNGTGTYDGLFALYGGDGIKISAPLGISTPEGGIVDQVKIPDWVGLSVYTPDGELANHVIIEAKDYTITVQKPANGTAKANKQKAKAGDTVTVTATPAKGYTVDQMTYTDAAGKVTTIPSSGKFEMPASDVTVKATFKKKKAATVKPSGVLLATATSSGDTDIAVTWTKMKNVEGYDVFFAKCNTRGKDYPVKKIATIKGNKTFSWTKTGLKKGKPYKFCVKAYVKKNGKKQYVKTSPLSHAYTANGSRHYTNARSVTVDKDNLSLKKGKSSQLAPTVQKLKAKKKLMSKNHEPKLRYLSSNKKIATVSSSGRIKAVSKGTCTVYAYAHNGVYTTIKVTVK